MKNLTPQLYAGRIAGGFKSACLSSFAANGLGTFQVGLMPSLPSPVAAPPCRQVRLTANLHCWSSSKGASDFYSLQWAERAEASQIPIAFDAAKWTERLKRLMPIKLCPIVPGEAAPYEPSPRPLIQGQHLQYQSRKLRPAGHGLVVEAQKTF
jgi:hypothetical protein